MDLLERLDEMEKAIKLPSFRSNSGRANEVNYWVFDYEPQRELEVRARIEYLKNKNKKGLDDYNLAVYDLYDLIIQYLKDQDFLEGCFEFEKEEGFNYVCKCISQSMKFNNEDSWLIEYIKQNTTENSIVFIIGVGKCYPILRSHKILNNLHMAFRNAPVVLFYPGSYTELELVLFNEIKDNNYYRAFKLVK